MTAMIQAGDSLAKCICQKSSVYISDKATIKHQRKSCMDDRGKILNNCMNETLCLALLGNISNVEFKFRSKKKRPNSSSLPELTQDCLHILDEEPCFYRQCQQLRSQLFAEPNTQCQNSPFCVHCAVVIFGSVINWQRKFDFPGGCRPAHSQWREVGRLAGPTEQL